MASPNLLNGMCGFSALQHKALLNTFSQAGGADTFSTITVGLNGGNAGLINLLPPTAAKGQVQFSTADNTGNTTTAVSFAAQAGARTYTVPDAGGNASFLMTAGTAATATITKISTGATPVPLIDIAGTTLTPAAGAANVCLVTIQLVDGSGANLARIIPLLIYLSDSATGQGVTATTASGAVAAGASGTDIVDLTAKKVKQVITDATGKYILSITDAAKTGFYIVASTSQGLKVSAQLTAGNYG